MSGDSIPLPEQWDAGTFPAEGWTPSSASSPPQAWCHSLLPRRPHLPVWGVKLLCLGPENHSMLLGALWLVAGLHHALHVWLCEIQPMCADTWLERRKKEQFWLFFLSFFFLSFLFNAQAGNLCSSSSNMLMQAFIAIDFSESECMLTILVDPGQEQACLVTLDKAYQN